MNILLKITKLKNILRLLNKQPSLQIYNTTYPHTHPLIRFMYSKHNVKKQNSKSEVVFASHNQLQEQSNAAFDDFKQIIQNIQDLDDEYESLSQDQHEGLHNYEYQFHYEEHNTIQKVMGEHNFKKHKQLKTNRSTLQNLIEKTKTLQQKHPKYQFIQVDQQKGKENAQSFMTHLEHNFNKLQITQIIKIIQIYHKNRRSNNRYGDKKMGLQSKIKTVYVQDKDQSSIFNEIKQKMVHFMNYYTYHDKNYQYIESVLDLLAKSHIEHITVINFETQALQINYNNNKMMNILKSREFINQINSGITIERQIKLQPYQNERKPRYNEQKFTNALQQAFKLKDRAKMQKINLKSSSNVMFKNEDKQDNSKKILGDDEPVIYQKKRSLLTPQLQQQNKKYIYCFELPYNIKQEQAQQFVKYLNESKNIIIKHFYLFSYKEFINKNYQFDIIYKVPDDFMDKSNKMIRQSTSIPLESMIGKTHQHGDKISDALILKIKKQNYSRFNKSFIILRLQKESDKQRIFNKTSRLFGINYKNLKNIKMEDGYSKNMVVLKGIPWGLSSKLLQKQVNQALNNKDLEVTIKANGNLTSKVVYLKFDYLSEALQAIKKINNMKIQNTSIKAYLTYGHCKIFNNQYQGKLSGSFEELKKKISESKSQYQKFYTKKDMK